MSREGGRRSRREFLKRSVALSSGVALGLSTTESVLGSNERISVGFIGVGNRGSRLLQRFLRFQDVRVAAFSDVYQPYLDRDRSKVHPDILRGLGGRVPPMEEKIPGDVRKYRDFRRLLDDRGVDAVVIATPDHWHALQFTAACEAEKDVYVEKPLTMTVREGRRMVDVAKRTGRVVQVGLQRRSSAMYRALVGEIRGGKIGTVSVARAYRESNMFPHGIGREPDTDPPADFDWDMWLGPRAWRPYRHNLALYKFRWWKDYSSQVANWGVHYFDAIRWLLGEDAPSSVSAHGVRGALADDRTIPETMEVVFELPSGRIVVFGQYEASGGAAIRNGEIVLHGTKGNLTSNERQYTIEPTGGGQFQDRAPLGEPTTVEGPTEDTTEAHIGNFLECMRSRKTCHADVESAHRSTTFALLANIALETRSRIEWDPAEEHIKTPKEANALLHYEYRAPWKL